MFWLKTPTGPFPILPVRGILYLLAGFSMLGIVGLLADKQLERSARQGEVNSFEWERENVKVNSENHKKILSTDTDPLFRSLGYTPPAPAPDRHRILVIGDSFIWGDGLHNINIAWWRQLQWELERRGYANVDVIAAGVNGASTQDQYGWLSNSGLLGQTRPEVIVVGYVTNDPHMKYADGKSMVKQLLPDPNIEYFKKSLAADVFPTLSFQLATRAAGKPHTTPTDATGYPYNDWQLKILEGENFRAYQEMVGKLGDKVRELEIPLFFVTTPNAPKTEIYTLHYRPVQPLFEKAGIEFNDLLPALVRYCEKPSSQLAFGINPANGHPGPALTHFYAVQVADLLESRHPQALGPKSPAAYAPAINDWMPASLDPKPTRPGTWALLYPGSDTSLLRMPVREPHIALNFERPVSMRQVRLSPAKPGRFKVWAMLMDERTGYESREYVPLGEGEGGDILISLPPALAEKRVTSLRIARQSAPTPVEILATVDASKLEFNGGHAYFYPLDGRLPPIPGGGAAARTALVLLEDGKPLPLPGALHDHIRGIGKGRYSLWDGKLLFSSSDGSDPSRNRRQYAIALETADLVNLSIDFNSPAVRL